MVTRKHLAVRALSEGGKTAPSGLLRAQDATGSGRSQGEETWEKNNIFLCPRLEFQLSTWKGDRPSSSSSFLSQPQDSPVRAARESARCFIFHLVCTWHLAPFLGRGSFLLNSGSGEMSPATRQPAATAEVYLIVHAGPPLCSASEGFAIYCTPHNARAVASSVKPSQPRGSQPPLEPPLSLTASPTHNPTSYPLAFAT